MSEKKQASGFSDQSMTLSLMAFGLYAIGSKYFPIVTSWYKRYQFKIYVVGAYVLFVALVFLISFLAKKWKQRKYDHGVTQKDNTSVYLGLDEKNRKVHLKQKFRTTHTQVIGTTSAGKTESIILPWAIRDLENGSGMLIIDGKSDSGFLEKFYAYAVQAGREKDFHLFSLAQIEKSSSFNPLAGGSVQEAVERVFAAFKFENEYYRNVQYKLFLKIMLLIEDVGRKPSFALVQQLLTDADLLKVTLKKCRNRAISRELRAFADLTPKERDEKVSGLDAYLSHFATGEIGLLYNQEKPHIDFDEVLRSNKVCYFQLPTLYFPFLAEATGKLVLQSFCSAVAKRHLGMSAKAGFFSCYLDDFQDYVRHVGAVLQVA